MSWKLSNFMTSRLAQAITAAATTIYVDSDDVDLLPTLGVGDKAKAVIFNATDKEIVNITAWNTDGTLTVERGKESTTGTAFAAGTRIVHTPTAEILQAVLDATVQAVYRGTATGTNAITVTGSGSTPTPSDGDEVSFEVAATNTAAVTLSYTNGSTTIGPFDLVKQDRSALRTGELVAGYRAKAVYDASSGHFVLVRQGSKRYDITHVNTGPLDAGNLLPNGGFDDWHNGTNFATPASGTETAGNLVATYDGTIGAFTVSRQTFTLGQTDVPGGPKYYARWDQSSAGAASSFRRLRMKVPRVGKYALETVIASIYAKADIARNVTAKLIQSFGTGGGPSAEVTLVTETWSLTTAWQMFDITSLVSNINGKTLGSAGDDGLILELGLPVNTSMTIDFAMGQIELGDAASKTHSRLPWSTEQGGSGGVYPSLTALAAAIMAVGTGSAGLAQAWDADLDAVAALGGTGFATRTAANTWAQRQIVVGTGLVVTNPAGVAGDPTISLGTALTNYVADPLSIAELASITAPFGTAAFVADNTLAHLAGTETFSGNKTFTNTGLLIQDTDASHTLNFKPGSNLTANRIFTLTTGDADRTLDISAADVTITTQGAQLLDDTSFSAMRTTLSALGNTDPTITGSATISGAFPILKLIDTSAAANSQGWRLWGIGTGLVLQTLSDDELTATTAMQVARSGSTISAINFPNSDVVFSAVSPTSVYSAGFRGVPNIAGDKSTSYTPSAAVLTDAGAYIGFSATATYTIPTNANNAYPIGTTIMIENLNGGGTLTIHPDTGVTLRRGDGTAGTGDRTVAANSCVTIRKRGTNEWYIYGIFT